MTGDLLKKIRGEVTSLLTRILKVCTTRAELRRLVIGGCISIFLANALNTRNTSKGSRLGRELRFVI